MYYVRECILPGSFLLLPWRGSCVLSPLALLRHGDMTPSRSMYLTSHHEKELVDRLPKDHHPKPCWMAYALSQRKTQNYESRTKGYCLSYCCVAPEFGLGRICPPRRKALLPSPKEKGSHRVGHHRVFDKGRNWTCIQGSLRRADRFRSRALFGSWPAPSGHLPLLFRRPYHPKGVLARGSWPSTSQAHSTRVEWHTLRWVYFFTVSPICTVTVYIQICSLHEIIFATLNSFLVIMSYPPTHLLSYATS